MDEFAQAVQFVRYTWANADDAALKLLGASPKTRDKALAKPVVLLDNAEGPEALAYFNMPVSYAEQNITINHQKIMPPSLMLEAAAHEYRHGSQLWGTNPLWRTYVQHVTPLKTAPLLLSVAGLITSNPTLIVAGLVGYWNSDMIMDFIPSRSIEPAAYRDGFLFNPDTYKSEPSYLEKDEPLGTLWDNIKTIVSGTLCTRERIALFKKTKTECVGGNALFPANTPPDIAFANWKERGSPAA